MQITFYNNYKLANNYNEVLHPNFKNVYLSTLESYILDLPEVYLTYEGNFKFNVNTVGNGLLNNIYNVNYFKILDRQIIRYYFIDNIEVVNNVAIVYYSQDFWNSYANNIAKFRSGYITNSSITSFSQGDLEQYELPLQHITKNGVVYDIIWGGENEYAIIAQCQRYKLSTGENIQTNRACSTVIITKNHIKTPFDLSTAQFYCNCIVRHQGEVQENDYFYEFDNFTIVPYELINSIDVTEYQNYSVYASLNIETPPFIEMCTFATIGSPFNKMTPLINFNVIHKNIEANSLTIGFGTFKSNYGYAYNGQDKSIKIGYYIDNVDFKLIIGYDGKLIDITSDFIYNVPFTSINGEISQTRKIAYETQIKNGVMGLINGVIDLGSGVIDVANGAPEKVTKYRYGKSGKLTSRVTSTDRNIGSFGDIQSGVNSIVNGAWDIKVAKTPRFQSTYGAFVLGNNGINSMYGLIVYNILSSNLNQVQEAINHLGYECYHLLKENELFEPLKSVNAYYIKMQYANWYGAPQDVCNALSNIVKNGVRIINNIEGINNV